MIKKFLSEAAERKLPLLTEILLSSKKAAN